VINHATIKLNLPCGCVADITPEIARKIRASINSQLRRKKTGGRKGGRPKGSKDKAPRKRVTDRS
jgi:hypothetical protein